MARANKTYRLDESIPARIRSQAQRNRISISDMVNFMLLYALEELESGHVIVPTKPGRAVVDWQKLGVSSVEG